MNRKMILMLVAVAAVLFSTNSSAQTTCCNTETDYVQVNGYAEREVVPNQIYINIVIDENDSKTAKSKVGLEQLEKDMVEALNKLGIDTKKNLSVEDLASSFKDFSFRKSEVRTSKNYQLLVGDAITLSKVVMALENIGISNVSIDRVSHTDLIALKNEVRIEAMKNAKSIAEALAEAVGQKAKQAISIIDSERTYPYEMNGRVAGVSMKSKATILYDSIETAPEIEFKKIKLTHNITAKFRLF